MPFVPRKRRLSDAGYRPSGSVRKKLRHISPSSRPNRVPSSSQTFFDMDIDAGSETDRYALEMPVSSAPASPKFDDDNDNIPSSPINLEPLPEIIPATPKRASNNTPKPQTPLSVLIGSPAHLRGRPRIRRSRRNPLADSELRSAPIQWPNQAVMSEMRRETAEKLEEFEVIQEKRIACQEMGAPNVEEDLAS